MLKEIKRWRTGFQIVRQGSKPIQVGRAFASDTTLATESDEELHEILLLRDQRQSFDRTAVVRRKSRVAPKPLESVTYLRSEISLLDLDLSSAAHFHMRERLDVFARLLAIMAILSSRGLFPKHAPFQVTGAKWQIQRGSKVRGSQAAHLALMVKVAGFDLTHFVEDPLAIESIKALHTHTHEVPTVMNEVDSWLEKALLRGTIQAIGRRYMEQCAGGLSINELGPILRSDYVLLAKHGRLKIEDKLGKLASEIQKCTDENAAIKLAQKIEILDGYWRALDPASLPESISQAGLQNLSLVFEDDSKV